ncbi:SRPBCC family protein [Ornithinimicrobium sp. Arc0846-15]|nr:SRPBCC family protein [Ornithinimicrobium laminariae]
MSDFAADQIVSESMVINAPASTIFNIVADPRQHSRIDGSGTVQSVVIGPERLSRGAEFGAQMKMFGVPYKISNRVVEFEEGTLIAWRHFGGHRWRYELRPIGENETVVTESFDYSRYKGLPAKIIEKANFPTKNRAGIVETLRKLKLAAEDDAT